MISRFLVTIIISVLLGVISGTSISFIPLLAPSTEVKEVSLVPQTAKITFASSECCAVYEPVSTEGHDIIYYEESDPEDDQPVDEMSQTEVAEVKAEIVIEPVEETKILEVTPSPLPVESAVSEADESQTGLNADLIFNLINEKRVAAGRAPLVKDSAICEVANSRAPELSGELASGYLHRGFHSRQLPYWAAENVIYMRSEQAAVSWWMNSSVHRGQLMGDFKYSCVACLGESCAQIFTNYTPKVTG